MQSDFLCILLIVSAQWVTCNGQAACCSKDFLIQDETSILFSVSSESKHCGCSGVLSSPTDVVIGNSSVSATLQTQNRAIQNLTAELSQQKALNREMMTTVGDLLTRINAMQASLATVSAQMCPPIVLNNTSPVVLNALANGKQTSVWCATGYQGGGSIICRTDGITAQWDTTNFKPCLWANRVAGGGQGFYETGYANTTAFNSATGVAMDFDRSEMYIADSRNGVVRKMTRDGALITVAGRPGRLGDPSGATAYPAAYESPSANSSYLTIPNSVVFERSTRNVYVQATDRVYKIDASGVLSTIHNISNNWTKYRSSEAGGNGISLDRQGNLFIVDSLFYCQIVMRSPDGTVAVIAGSGDCAPSSESYKDGASATMTALYQPKHVAVADSGAIYFTDGGRIMEVNRSTGMIFTIAGGGKQDYVNNSIAKDVALPDLTGIALHPSGDIFAITQYTSVIYRLSPRTGMLTTWLEDSKTFAYFGNMAQIQFNADYSALYAASYFRWGILLLKP